MQKQPVVLDIASSSFKANPYGLLAELRDCAPVARMSAGPGQDYWLVTCYELVQRVLNDPAFVCDPRNAGDASAPGPFNDCDEVVRVFVQGGLLFSDPPRHTRLRRLVNKAFTVPVVEQLRPQIAQLCSELLDQFASRSHVDLVKDFATPLPAMVICNLLGVPLKDSERLLAWADVVTQNSPFLRGEDVAKSLQGFRDYIETMIAERSVSPRADDLVTELVHAEVEGDQLSHEELLSLIFLLLIAGHETTVMLIANGTLLMLQHPKQLQLLRERPLLAPGMVEEILRFHAPFQSPSRFAATDVILGGERIKRGDRVVAMVSAANHDPAQFENPEAFDISRGSRRHLTFGFGPHHCLGAALARLEGLIALPLLFERFPNLRLDAPAASIRWRTGLSSNGPAVLPVAWN